MTVEYGKELRSLREVGDRVVACIDGMESAFSYVLGADGSRSTVRREIGLVAEGYDLDDEWAIADVEASRWADQPGVMRTFIYEDGVVVFVLPMSPTRYRLVSSKPNALACLEADMPVDHVYREGSFRISVRQVSEYHRGRVFLAGDSAHTHSPVGGRGMNLGIADAAHFAACYVGGTLERYSQDRHRIGSETIAFTERVRKAITRRGGFLLNHSRRRILQLLDVAAMVPGVPAGLTRQMVSGEF